MIVISMTSLPSLSSKPVIASSSSSPPRSSSLRSSPATSISFPYNSTENKPPSAAGTQIRSSTTSRSETFGQYINRETLLPETSKAAARVTKMEGATVAENWREIHGSNNWEGMLDPMDPVLRSEILRYGDFTQACYDAFDWDIHSKYCGTSRYDSASFFDRIGISDCGYRVNRFLYAASNQKIGKFFRYSKHQKAWSSRANWIGYVAVCDDPKEIQRLGRRDILIAWRGTVTNMEWIEDLMDSLQPAKFGKQDDIDESIQVESGFLDFYTEKEEEDQQDSEAPPYCKYSAREQILAEVKRLVDLYRDEELSITITGHSLGSALATLSAYDLAEMGLTTRSDGSKIPTTVFSFSGPRVGNTRFKDRCMELGLKVLRVLNLHDVVPKVPGLVVNEKADEKIGKLAEDLLHYPWSFSHVGVELSLDHKVSPYLKETDDLSNFHNLEGLLHLVNGYHGKGLEFSSSTGRDIALVNKSSDFLKEELEMPPSWRQDENKGLVRGADGRWFVPPRDVEAHPADTHIHLQKAFSSVV